MMERSGFTAIQKGEGDGPGMLDTDWILGLGIIFRDGQGWVDGGVRTVGQCDTMVGL